MNLDEVLYIVVAGVQRKADHVTQNYLALRHCIEESKFCAHEIVELHQLAQKLPSIHLNDDHLLDYDAHLDDPHWHFVNRLLCTLTFLNMAGLMGQWIELLAKEEKKRKKDKGTTPNEVQRKLPIDEIIGGSANDSISQAVNEIEQSSEIKKRISESVIGRAWSKDIQRMGFDVETRADKKKALEKYTEKLISGLTILYLVGRVDADAELSENISQFVAQAKKEWEKSQKPK